MANNFSYFSDDCRQPGAGADGETLLLGTEKRSAAKEKSTIQKLKLDFETSV